MCVSLHACTRVCVCIYVYGLCGGDCGVLVKKGDVHGTAKWGVSEVVGNKKEEAFSREGQKRFARV